MTGQAGLAPGEVRPERALVLHPDIQTERARRDPQAALAEAVSLAAALPGLTVVDAQVVRLPRAHPAGLFGSGKIEELKSGIEAGRSGWSSSTARSRRCSSATSNAPGGSSFWTAPG